MKITCTMDEYIQIIRMCQRNIVLNECQGCVLESICGGNVLEDAVEFELEDHEELDLEYVTYERRE